MHFIIKFSSILIGITLICMLSRGESTFYDAKTSSQDHGMLFNMFLKSIESRLRGQVGKVRLM